MCEREVNLAFVEHHYGNDMAQRLALYMERERP
jgi:hypothetical protein